MDKIQLMLLLVVGVIIGYMVYAGQGTGVPFSITNPTPTETFKTTIVCQADSACVTSATANGAPADIQAKCVNGLCEYIIPQPKITGDTE